MKKYKTMRISEVIAELEQAKSEIGDAPVVMSSDTEGNDYSTIQKDSFCIGENERMLRIYPYNERIDDPLEEVIPN